jgi:hypothetical protein
MLWQGSWGAGACERLSGIRPIAWENVATFGCLDILQLVGDGRGGMEVVNGTGYVSSGKDLDPIPQELLLTGRLPCVQLPIFPH